MNPRWQFNRFDVQGPWGRSLVEKTCLWETILPKVIAYERMTWGHIETDRKHNHEVPVQNLSKNAQKRLAKLKLDDVDSLYRFRFTGTQRLWGIRDRETFIVLWWDPDHAICPSSKRNT